MLSKVTTYFYYLFISLYIQCLLLSETEIFFYLNFIIFSPYYTQDCKLHKKSLFTRISLMPEQSGTEQALNIHVLYKISDYNYTFNSMLI